MTDEWITGAIEDLDVDAAWSTEMLPHKDFLDIWCTTSRVHDALGFVKASFVRAYSWSPFAVLYRPLAVRVGSGQTPQCAES